MNMDLTSLANVVARRVARHSPVIEGRSRPGIFSISEAGDCSRRRQLSYNGAEQYSRGIKGAISIAVGHAVEAEAVKRFFIQDNQRALAWENFIGHIDGMVEIEHPKVLFPDGPLLIAVDVKALRSGFVNKTAGIYAGKKGWEAACKEAGYTTTWDSGWGDYVPPVYYGGTGCKVAYPGYYAQGQMYMHAMKRNTKEKMDSDHFIFLVFDVETKEYFVEIINYDEAAVNEIVASTNNIVVADLEGRIVPRPDGYSPQKFPCSYCPYKETCWASESTELASFLGSGVFEAAYEHAVSVED